MSDVLFEDSYISSGDDAIAIKAGWDCAGYDAPGAAPSNNVSALTRRPRPSRKQQKTNTRAKTWRWAMRWGETAMVCVRPKAAVTSLATLEGKGVQSLVTGGPSLVILEGKVCNPV